MKATDDEGVRMGLMAALRWVFGTDESCRKADDRERVAASIDRMGQEADKLTAQLAAHRPSTFEDAVQRLSGEM